MAAKAFQATILIFIAIIFSAGGALAETPAERFSGFDPDSTVRVNHQPLTDYLELSVLPVGRSYRILGNEKAESYTGSRIKTSKSLSPSRFEGNRILIHAFSDEFKEFFRAYQEGLERLSNRRSLREFNKAEQAAFWLNLYNVIVINKLVEEYPISNLKSLRSSKRGKKSFWDEKVATIEGVPLSLNDIEDILFANFDTPLVAFGLWQGSIGGPRLANFAYTGRNVWVSLERNAVEFVNSNRGLRPPTGSSLKVSDYYEWTAPAFGTSEDHVLMFIKEYADPNFAGDVSNVTSLSFKIYDWTIADLLGGSKHTGQHSQLGGVLGGKTNDVGANPSGAPAGDAGGGGSFGGLKTFYDFARENQVPSMPGIPPQAAELLWGMKMNTRQPIPVITTEECAPGEFCTVENLNFNDNGPDG